MTQYLWPDAAPAAVLLTFDVDAEAPHLWRSRNEGPRLAELEQRRFGPRAGVARLLALLDAHQLTGTFYVPGHTVTRHPQVVAEIAAAGHELALHGYLHEPPTQIEPAMFRETMVRSIDALGNVTGAQPTGYRSPSWDMTAAAFEVLRELGITHDSSLMGYDHPYWVGDLVEVPVDWATDDAPFYRYVGKGDTRPPTAPTALIDAWHTELTAACRFGTLLNITMHPWLSGRAARAQALDSLLAAIRASGAWTGTVDALAAWHAANHRQPRIELDELMGHGDG